MWKPPEQRIRHEWGRRSIPVSEYRIFGERVHVAFSPKARLLDSNGSKNSCLCIGVARETASDTHFFHLVEVKSCLRSVATSSISRRSFVCVGVASAGPFAPSILTRVCVFDTDGVWGHHCCVSLSRASNTGCVKLIERETHLI